MPSSEWYREASSVVEHVRLATMGRGAVPVIAGYDDLAEIRRGGQGVVYAAKQRSTRRRVAIKLLLDGAYASNTTRRRFEREIDLVAALRNPNIVRIYDSGISDEGRPYFVMEYVDGAPLDRYVNDIGLAHRSDTNASKTTATEKDRVRRLLTLFLPICEAVQHAHQRGIIHRDLKPANIRIDSDDVPRVLDFGLARGLYATQDEHPNPDSSSAAELTVSGQFMGSLPWASPEHASGNPDAIDTRSDIYSLGVILHYLLTGKFPYAVDGSPRDVLDNILQTQPTSPSSLIRGINADVDTIVLKCLNKEPQRRYQSAGDLTDDIRHYLAGEPIQARRDSAWYTIRKTVRRYQWAVAGVGVILLVVIAGLIVSLSLWRDADKQRRRADDERVLAQEQRRVAEQKTQQAQAVNDFLVSMLSAANPMEVHGRDVRVADLLDGAADDAGQKFVEAPQTEAAVRYAVGRSYLALGSFDEAERQLTAALSLAQTHPNSDPSDRLEAMQLLGEIYHRQGRFETAENMLRESFAQQQDAWGNDDPRTLYAKHKLAVLLADWGKFEEAEPLACQVLDSRRLILGPEHRETLASMSFVAGCMMRRGKFEEAQLLFEETLELQRRVLGEDNGEIVTTMSNLADVLSQRDQKERSDELNVQVYELAQHMFGKEHPRTWLALHQLGHSRMTLKRYDEAIDYLTQAMEGQRKIFGFDHPAVIDTASVLASSLRYAGRLDEAEAIYREVLDAARRVFGEEHPNTVTFMNNYAGVLMSMKRPADAEPIYRQAYQTIASKLGENHWLAAAFQGNLGQSIMLQKRYAEAEPHLLAEYNIMLKVLGPDHERTQSAAVDLVMLYEGWNKPELVAEYRKRSGNLKPPQ